MNRCRAAVRRRLRPDGGSMIVEFVFLTVLVLVPLLYLVGTLGRLQAGAYAASGAAREAARAYVTSPEEARASGRGQVAAVLVADAHGFTAEQVSLNVSCSSDPCLAPDGQVVVDVAVQVPVPLVPDFMAGVVPTSVTMTASHLAAVDRFRSG